MVDEYSLCIWYLQNNYTPHAKLLIGSQDAAASLEKKAHFTTGVIIGSPVMAMESVAMVLYLPRICPLPMYIGTGKLFVDL